MAATVRLWELQKCPPTKCHVASSNVVVIDQNNFMFLTRNQHSHYEAHAYNIAENAWSIKCTMKNGIAAAPSLAYDSTNFTMFITDGSEQLRTYAFNTMASCKYALSSPIPDYSRMVVIGGICHVIGYRDNRLVHHKYPMGLRCAPQTKVFSSIIGSKSDAIGVIHVTKQQEMIIFGEYNKSLRKMHPITIYSPSTSHYRTLDFTLPNKCRGGTYVITMDQRYILILGGEGSDAIYIYDVRTMSISQSVISLPFAGKCLAVIMENKTDSELLVNGYMRKASSLYNMNIPLALFGLVLRRIEMEQVHVIVKPGGKDWMKSALHWKLPVVEILNVKP